MEDLVAAYAVCSEPCRRYILQNPLLLIGLDCIMDIDTILAGKRHHLLHGLPEKIHVIKPERGLDLFKKLYILDVQHITQSVQINSKNDCKNREKIANFAS